ncbi:translation initiation factor IF-3 [Candidatus Nomurabacteria bacterium]|nr:translation initiation factor IF-3 [Candidatus Saccharibacteria bacterium]MCA9313281.1 translation initiation factor IF-3 [Candidatus Saccharibacteria bacterium]MCB9822228.1 translation initiation factor IF-3 [Candidatus Nomurabacteria bacterium]
MKIAHQPQTRLNHAIRANELRVIDEDGNQLGVLSRTEALQKAELAGLDLVEISPNATPPVAKIIDWGKYNYQKTKQIQKQKKVAKSVDLKQIRLGMRIGDNDLDIKINKTRKFLEAGHKVKVMLLYRGRENAHKELGFALFDRITEKLQDVASIDQPAQLSGRNLTITYRRSSNAKN